MINAPKTPFERERLALQASVAIAAIVPVVTGLWGVVGGTGMAGSFSDGHVRYLSGILLGIGLMFWAMTPRLESWTWPFRMLCALVVLGGLARIGAAFAGGGGSATYFALIMELVITPWLLVWRERIESLSRRPPPEAPAVDAPDASV